MKYYMYTHMNVATTKKKVTREFERAWRNGRV